VRRARQRPPLFPSLSHRSVLMMRRAQPEIVTEMAAWVHALAPWKVFATHTFRWEASLWSARRVYERFMREALPGVSFFYAIEQNPCRDGHHVHAMWDSDAAPRKATHRRWLDLYGRNRIEPILSKGDVLNYCAKYVCKEGAWWDFHLSQRVMSGHTNGGTVTAGRTSTVPPERLAASDLL